MARPRQFPTSDAVPTLGANGGRAYRPSTLGGPDLISESTAGALHRQARSLHHPAVAGWYDPVSIMCVLDLVLRLENDEPFRPQGFVRHLSQEYTQFSWAPITAGRILSDLAEAALAVDPENPPIAKQLTHGGHRYWVNVSPVNWQWLIDARLALGKLAEQTVALEQAGHTIPRGTFPFEVLDAVPYNGERAAA